MTRMPCGAVGYTQPGGGLPVGDKNGIGTGAAPLVCVRPTVINAPASTASGKVHFRPFWPRRRSRSRSCHRGRSSACDCSLCRNYRQTSRQNGRHWSNNADRSCVGPFTDPDRDSTDHSQDHIGKALRHPHQKADDQALQRMR